MLRSIQEFGYINFLLLWYSTYRFLIGWIDCLFGE